jgi:PAS domain-containing protein
MEDAAFIVDDHGRIRFLNQAARLLLAIDIIDYTDLYLFAMLPLSDSDNSLVRYQHAPSAGEEVKFMQRLDNRRWYEVTFQPVGPYSLIFFHDVTIRNTLNERFKLTHFSVDHIWDVVLWVRPNGSILSANPAARELLGYPYGELIRMSFPDFVEPPLG